MAQRLPLGLQDFRKIIERDFKYIYKTQYIYEMCRTPGAYFLSRPRRFGKSITLAVLQELYLGSKELFKGLWIEDQWDWSRKHPVLRISFTALGFQENGLQESLSYALDELIRKNQLPPIQGNINNKFSYLIEQLSQNGKVVVLIDEYDAPIINYLGKEIDKAYENREILKSFYTVLKDLDSYLELVFITGVSKFSKVGIFSGMNNLSDLSMHPAYATMLGYTQQELENNFEEELEDTANSLQFSKTELLDKLRWWYNGYRFHPDAERVYNPVSVNNFFNRKEFENFWFETGTPSFLINLLKQEGIYNFKLDPQPKQSFDSFELENLNVLLVATQNGYFDCPHSPTGKFYLKEGEIYRYGTTGKTTVGRGYSETWLIKNNLTFKVLMEGDLATVTLAQTTLIGQYSLLPENMQRPLPSEETAKPYWFRLVLPPGNKSLD